MKRFFLSVVVTILTTMALFAQDWTQPDTGKYPAYGVFFVKVNVNGTTATSGVTVGAFIDDECRGVATTSESGLVYLQVAGNNQEGLTSDTGKNVELRVKKGSVIYVMKEELTWDAETHGNPSNPIVLDVYEFSSMSMPTSINLPKGQTIDLLEQLTFNYGESKTIKYLDLPFASTLMWEVEEDDYATIEENVLTANKVTTSSGINLTGKFWYSTPELEAGDLSATSKLVIYDAITKITLPEKIVIDKDNAPIIDLMKELSFYMGGSDAVTADELPIAVDVEWSLPTGCTDLTLSGNSLTGVKGTNTQTITLNATLAIDASVTASTEVEVYVKLTGIAPADNTLTALKFGLGETLEFALAYTPADATYKDKYFVSISSTVENDCQVATSIIPGVAGNIALQGVGVGGFTLEFVDSDINTLGEIGGEVGAVYDYAEGWSWISLLSLTDAMKTPAGLNNSAFGGAIIDLRSQTQATYNDETYGFFGSLTTIDNGAYQVKLSKANREVVYGGKRGAFGEEITSSVIATGTLYKGWTWLYFPYAKAIDIEGLNQMMSQTTGWTAGDRIITKNGFAEWSGSTNQFEAASFSIAPGESCLVYRAASGTMNWIPEAQIDGVEMGAPSTKAPKMSPWSYNSHAYRDNMTIVAKVEGNAELEIGAYVGDECRGEGKLVELNGENYYFITVHGTTGEVVSFKAFDGVSYSDFSITMPFAGMIGSLSAPMMLSGDFVNGINTIASEDEPEAQIVDLYGHAATKDAHGFFVVRQNGETRKVLR